MGFHCAGPKRQHYVQKADPTIRTASRRDSVLLERIASDRAPLPPHLARHFLVYSFSRKKSNISPQSYHNYFILDKLLTVESKHDKLYFVDTEVYPSSAEGNGLENRQAG